ncbi:hypothetical protein HK105_202332 [Polyrhizophydium stewartii]|uniref:Ankyrin repeat protein n=1 Tax=Polyrhizophydium stewartii TaxID=2732419 RepID=A0ABR4NEF8_9FUNG
MVHLVALPTELLVAICVRAGRMDPLSLPRIEATCRTLRRLLTSRVAALAWRAAALSLDRSSGLCALIERPRGGEREQTAGSGSEAAHLPWNHMLEAAVRLAALRVAWEPARARSQLVMLLLRGDIGRRSTKGRALAEAVRMDRVGVVRALLAYDVPLDGPVKYGGSLLHLAVHVRNASDCQVLAELLKHVVAGEADPRPVQRNGRVDRSTALWINERDQSGRTPLDLVHTRQHGNRRRHMARLLIDRGAIATTPEAAVHSAINARRPDLLAKLCAEIRNVGEVTGRRPSPFIVAAQVGDAGCCDVLIRAGAAPKGLFGVDEHTREMFGYNMQSEVEFSTQLYPDEGRIETFSILAHYRIVFNLETSSGAETGLVEAAPTESQVAKTLELMDRLVDIGASVHHEQANGWTTETSEQWCDEHAHPVLKRKLAELNDRRVRPMRLVW